jgi:hypothetical protein
MFDEGKLGVDVSICHFFNRVNILNLDECQNLVRR